MTLESEFIDNECKFLCCYVSFISATVVGVQLTLSVERGVRIEWESIANQPQEFGAVYSYTIFYKKDGPSREESSLTIPLGSRFTIINNLNEGTVYQFELAVSKQVGTEERFGDRSTPKRIRIVGESGVEEGNN